MLLSTSNSDETLTGVRNRQVKAIVVLLALIFGLLISLEVLTRVVVEKRSAVQRELNREDQEAVAIRRNPASHTKQLLIVGNSLVGLGLDFRLLQKQLSPAWQVHRCWIYNTTYDDWYFGMRRLFAEGSRPDVVAIMFAGMHWFSSGIRGDYSAAYLFNTTDIPEMASELHLDRTTASDLIFARYSRFYAVRAEIRKAVLQSILPDLPQMYDLLKPAMSVPRPPDEVLAIIVPRIAKMRQLAEENGAHLVLIVPPIPRPGQEYHAELTAAAQKTGVEALMPMTYLDVPPSDFGDDMHLTPKGATLYTSRLLPVLKSAIDASETTHAAQFSKASVQSFTADTRNRR